MQECFHPERGLPLPLALFPTVCENCIELNMGTVSGFIFAEIISIFFLAVGVYFIAGQDGVRQSRGKRSYMWWYLLVTLGTREAEAGGP